MIRFDTKMKRKKMFDASNMVHRLKNRKTRKDPEWLSKLLDTKRGSSLIFSRYGFYILDL